MRTSRLVGRRLKPWTRSYLALHVQVKVNILFVCTGNQTRYVLAAMWRTDTGRSWSGLARKYGPRVLVWGIDVMIKWIRILALALVALFLLFAVGVLVEWRFPGNNDWTDQDMVIAYGFGLLRAVLWLGFVVNNAFFLFRGHWPRFRRYALIASVVLPLGNYIIRPIVVQLSYSTKVAEYIELQDSFPYLNLTLYSSGKFISTTYDAAYHVENSGNTEWDGGVLRLEFFDEPSWYLDYKYELVDGHLIPNDQVMPNLEIHY